MPRHSSVKPCIVINESDKPYLLAVTEGGGKLNASFTCSINNGSVSSSFFAINLVMLASL